MKKLIAAANAYKKLCFLQSDVSFSEGGLVKLFPAPRVPQSTAGI